MRHEQARREGLFERRRKDGYLRLKIGGMRFEV
jgi:hypothetical protein